MVTNSSANIPTGASGTVLQGGGVGSNSVFSTATYPATTTVDQLLYSSSANVVAGLTNGSTGEVLTATTGGPPSWAAPASSGIPTIGASTADGIVTWSGTGGAAVLSTATTVSSTGIVKGPDGLVTGPTYSFTSAATSGMYFGSGALKFSSGGVAFLQSTTSILKTLIFTDFSSNSVAFRQVANSNATFNVTVSDCIVLATNAAARTITWTSSNSGQIIIIKDAAGTGLTANLTITKSGGTIDGAANYVINTNYGSVFLISDGTNLHVLAKY